MSTARTAVALCLTFSLASSLASGAPRPDRDALAAYAADAGESPWGRVKSLAGSMTSRELFVYALALCEANVNIERIEPLMQAAGRMQDRDEESRGYGNFRWSWQDGSVEDYNAVEFCMQAGALMWLRHRDKLSAGAAASLREITDYAVQGCLRHRVTPSYTNIALMNAGNLILLGETLDREDVADEGYKRLDQIVMYTWRFGIHEYDSPTYYGVDLECLGLIEAFCRREAGRKQARALLNLMWQDVALNWFPPSLRLAGARSRDYDYLRGKGMLENQLWYHGWLEGEARGGTGLVFQILARYEPDPGLQQMSATRFPRLVRQKWGAGAGDAKTHMMFEDVTLSTSGANYGPMDVPLSVDFAGAPDSLRCYFIPDARRDPYGKKRVPLGTHEKAVHLRPMWAAAQSRTDALGLVIYRDRDIPDNPPTLESHFVMPRDVDGFWIGNQAVELPADQPRAIEIGAGQALFVRKGTAVVGIRVPWARGLDGGSAPAALVYDGNSHGAARLTVAHHSFWGVEQTSAAAGAALWVRVGSGINSDEAFAEWRDRFAAAEATASGGDGVVRIRVAGDEEPLVVASAEPYLGCLELAPAHTEAILELDGEDIGGAILGELEIVQTFEERAASAGPVAIPAGESVVWEAEAGVVMPGMEVDTDDEAFGAQFVWAPGQPGARGGGMGTVTWKLQVEEEGQYYLWARLLCPTPDDDSFFVRVFTEQAEMVARTDWHTGVHDSWEWAPVGFAGSSGATPLHLPGGELCIEFLTREDGARVDSLFITPDANDKPN